jgi:hypothetical protein
MTAEEWLADFCRQVGADAPDEARRDEILRLASVAAHGSERRAAPIACWIAGAAGRPLGELIEVAEGVA